MKSILISIKPEWVEKILNGDKTIEIRKTMPKCELPCKVYIYCTKGKQKLLEILHKGEIKWFGKDENDRYEENIFIKQPFSFDNINKDKWLGKVVAEFTLNTAGEFKVFENSTVQYWNYHDLEKSCLTYDEISNYVGRNKIGYAWHIDNLKIYDKPKELEEFCNYYKDIDDFDVFDIKPCYRLKRLKKPPQSWCYVEEV